MLSCVACARCQLQAARQRLRRHDHRAGGHDLGGILAGRALDVVDAHMEARPVTERQEARQGGLRHQRIADDDLARGRSDASRAPCHDIDAHGPVKGGNVEGDARLAVSAHPDHA
jgi:hypothetical protein